MTEFTRRALAVLGCVAALACGKSAQEESMKSLPDDFKAFYQQFHEDTAYQVAHIQFPLQGYPYTDTVAAASGMYRWQREGWVYHKDLSKVPDVVQKFEFSPIGENMIIEYVIDTVSKGQVMRRFYKDGDEWKLIYLVQP